MGKLPIDDLLSLEPEGFDEYEMPNRQWFEYDGWIVFVDRKRRAVAGVQDCGGVYGVTIFGPTGFVSSECFSIHKEQAMKQGRHFITNGHWRGDTCGVDTPRSVDDNSGLDLWSFVGDSE